MSLAVFNISKVVENGVEIIPEFDPTSGTIRYVAHLIAPVGTINTFSHPKPFKCSIKSRSAKAVALVEEDANY
jgi:hypothetical protein